MVKDQQINGRPAVNSSNATITFIRPSFHGNMIDSAVFMLTDTGEDFVGKLGYQEGVSISTEPGEHVFMVVDQNIRFPRLMKAQVEAGKSYYAIVNPRGWPLITFALAPVKINEDFTFTHKDLPGWLSSTDWVKKSPKADEWTKTVKDVVHEARVSAYNKWLSNGQNVDPQFQLSKKDAYPR